MAAAVAASSLGGAKLQRTPQPAQPSSNGSTPGASGAGWLGQLGADLAALQQGQQQLQQELGLKDQASARSWNASTCCAIPGEVGGVCVLEVGGTGTSKGMRASVRAKAGGSGAD